MAARLPDNEPYRLFALRQAGLLDTEPDPAFDAVTRLASTLCGVPIALVSLVDADRQWFKSRVGLPAPQTHRDHAFCAHAILEEEPLVVPDATADPRFSANPLVTADPHIRFYAGVPIHAAEERVGTLCVIDRVPRELDVAQRERLRDLARLVDALIEARRFVRNQRHVALGPKWRIQPLPIRGVVKQHHEQYTQIGFIDCSNERFAIYRASLISHSC